MSTQVFRGEFDVPFPRSAVWPYLANTDSLNRAFGFPPVEYRPARDEDGVKILEATARHRGMTHRWREYPFDWKEPERYAVRRVFVSGPLREVTGSVTLAEGAGGTRVVVESAITPRNLVGGLLARFALGPQGMANFRAHCDRITGVLQGLREDPYPRGDDTPVHLARLEQRLGGLKPLGLPPALVDRLRRHLVEGHEEEVLRMRPFSLADRWHEDRRAVLRLFLHATRCGVLDLSWSVLCPGCRVPNLELGTLRDLKAEAHCDVCEISFGVDFDRLVELRFNVNPQVRPARAQIFCIGGPQNRPHVMAQHVLAAGEAVEWCLPSSQEVIRLRAREVSGGVRVFRDDAGAATGELRVGASGYDPPLLTLAPGTARLAVRNVDERPLSLLLERETWPDDIASAALLSTMPEFRRLFSSEVLAPGLEVGIQNLAILFTDLKGSTRFYQDVGDATAFAVVRDHFARLEAVVAEHEGTFVKTIGDAVMAVFPGAAPAAAAAVQMRSAIATWDDPRVPDPATFIKIGLHQGPVIAVTLNDRLDYFGSTVNMAARVQAQSAGGDIVVTREVLEDPDVAAVLASARLQTNEFTATLSGFERPVTLWRLMAIC